MKPMTSSQIRGNWATLLSAWNTDDSLDLGRVATEIDTLIAMKVDGIYSNGTAGEFHTQTEAEFDQISECLATKCDAAGMRFQIGVSHMSAQISRERLKRAVPLKPGAVQMILPDWFPVTEPEAVDFLQGMAETADGIGLVLYNPPHAKRVWNPEQIGRLVERVPQLIGLKTAGGLLECGLPESCCRAALDRPDDVRPACCAGGRGAVKKVHVGTHRAIYYRARLLQCGMRPAYGLPGRLGRCRLAHALALPFDPRRGGSAPAAGGAGV